MTQALLLSHEEGDDTSPQGRASRLRSTLLRHPVMVVLVLAVVARLVTVIGVAALSGGVVFADDGTYHLLATQRTTGETSGWTDYEYFLFRSTGTLMVPLTFLYTVFGPNLVLGQLLVAAAGAAAAGLTAALGARVAGPLAGLVAGLIVALLPSQVLFSSLLLKDAMVWCVLAAAALAAANALTRSGRAAAPWVVSLGLLLLLLGHLRVHTTLVVLYALVIAAAVRWRTCLPQLAAFVGLLVAVPLYLGAGPAGTGLLDGSLYTLDERRALNAAGASTAFVPPPQPTAGLPPSVTPAPATEPADPPPPPGPVAAGLRGLSVMLLEPYPGTTNGNARLQLALAENLVWWPVLALAVIGLGAIPQRRGQLLVPFLLAGAICLMYALAEGNFGTAYRHRGELVWAAALFAGVGAVRCRDWLRIRRSTAP